MAQGIVLAPTGGTFGAGRSVAPDNPLPVYSPTGFGMQISYGTFVADVVIAGQISTVTDAGLISFGQDTLGTYWPLPLYKAGGYTGVGVMVMGMSAVLLDAGTSTVGTVAVNPNPATSSTCIAITSTTIATLIAATSGSYNYRMGLQFSNSSGTLTTVMVGEGSTFGGKQLALAANGGGNNWKVAGYPGWKSTGTNTVTVASLTVGVGTVYANVDWYVGV